MPHKVPFGYYHHQANPEFFQNIASIFGQLSRHNKNTRRITQALAKLITARINPSSGGLGAEKVGKGVEGGISGESDVLAPTH